MRNDKIEENLLLLIISSSFSVHSLTLRSTIEAHSQIFPADFIVLLSSPDIAKGNLKQKTRHSTEMSSPGNKANLPYNGNLQEAIKHRDREAVKKLMSLREFNARKRNLQTPQVRVTSIFLSWWKH